jgi:hypothetical protein
MGTRIWLSVVLSALLLVACEPSSSSPTSVTSATGTTADISPPAALPKPPVSVPKIVGMSIAEARVALRAAHLRFKIVEHASPKPKGTVLEQAVDPGTLVRELRSIRLIIAKPEPPPPCGVFGNPWCYTFEGGSYISRPAAKFCLYFDCIASFWSGSGYVIQCQDGWFSKSGGISGSCSSHGGNWRYLYAA